MNAIRVYNPYHLGDQVYNFIFFYQLSHLLILKNIEIHYYCPEQYLSQMSEFIISNVKLFCFPHDKTYSGTEYGIRLHIGNDRLSLNIFNYKNKNFDEFYIEFYKQFVNMLTPSYLSDSMAANIKPVFHYYDADLILRYRAVEAKYREIDILIINSIPQSGQYFSYEKKTWDNYIIKLAKSGLNIVTTEKVLGSDIKCTTDNNYTIKTIAGISIGAQIIIAINTGPLSVCFNKYTLDHVKKIYVFDDTYNFIHPKIVKTRFIQDIKPAELLKLTNKYLLPAASRKFSGGLKFTNAHKAHAR